LVKGFKTFIRTSIIGATNKAILSACFAANILGVISQKIRIISAVAKVAMIVPQWNPNKDIHKAVTTADIAIFTRLFPINIVAINLSILVVRPWTLWALFTPLETIWRNFILPKAIIAVSEAENNIETMAKITNKIITNTLSIFNLF